MKGDFYMDNELSVMDRKRGNYELSYQVSPISYNLCHVLKVKTTIISLVPIYVI